MKVHKITCEKHGKIAVYCEDCLAEKLKECEEVLKEIVKLNQKIIHERDKEIWKLKEQLEIHKKSKPEMFKQQERNRIKKEIEKFKEEFLKEGQFDNDIICTLNDFVENLKEKICKE